MRTHDYSKNSKSCTNTRTTTLYIHMRGHLQHLSLCSAFCCGPSSANFFFKSGLQENEGGKKNAIRAGFDGGHGLALFRAQPLALRDAVHVLLTSSSLRLCRKLIALKNYLRRRQDVHSWPVTPPEKKKKKKRKKSWIFSFGAVLFQPSLSKNMNSSCNGIAVVSWYWFYFRL